MRTSLIRIGNSQGIRIPKILIEQCHLGAEVELEVEDKTLLVRAVTHPRQEWEESFRAMAAAGDDILLDGDLRRQSSWDEDEWQW